MTTIQTEVELGPSSDRTRKGPPLLNWFDANVRMFETWPVQVICCFFGFHLIVRCLLPVPIGFDEGEQFIVTQDWAWGYSSQPPLYNWIQRLSFSTFGYHDLSLVLVKQTILFLVYLTTYGIWRKVGLTVALASACTFSLFLLNEVGWEMQRTRTHLSLAVLMAALFLFLAVWIYQAQWDGKRKLMGYLGLGVILGLGVLAKYNFVVLPIGLGFSALLFSRTRAFVLSWEVIAMALVAALLATPHFLWYLEHASEIQDSFAGKFGIDEGVELGWLSSVRQFVETTFFFFLQPLIIFAIMALDWRDWKYPSFEIFSSLDSDSKTLVRWIGMGCLVAMFCIGVVAVVGGATQFRSRWLVPSAFLALGPALLLTRFLHGPNVQRLYWLAVLVIMTAGTVAVIQEATEGYEGKGDFANLPTDVVGSEEWASVVEGDSKAVVVIEDARVAALIRKANPEVRVVAPEYALPRMDGPLSVFLLAEMPEGPLDPKLTNFLALHFPYARAPKTIDASPDRNGYFNG